MSAPAPATALPLTGSPWPSRLIRVVARADHLPLTPLLLAFRIAIGAVFWNSGLTKLASWDATIALFRDEYQLPLLPPELAAAIGATFELSCPVLLLLGLATRLAALPLLAMTAVIQFCVYPGFWAQHLLWAAALSLLVIRGGGAVTVDALLVRLATRRGWLAAGPPR